MKALIAVTTLLLSFLVLGCATTGKLRNLELDMRQDEVRDVLGEPDAVRGSIFNEDGQLVELWEYGLFKTGTAAFYGWPTYYWLYFVENTLVQWGERGDWDETQDRIYEIRIR